jgi:hypothetical protein
MFQDYFSHGTYTDDVWTPTIANSGPLREVLDRAAERSHRRCAADLTIQMPQHHLESPDRLRLPFHVVNSFPARRATSTLRRTDRPLQVHAQQIRRHTPWSQLPHCGENETNADEESDEGAANEFDVAAVETRACADEWSGDSRWCCGI